MGPSETTIFGDFLKLLWYEEQQVLWRKGHWWVGSLTGINLKTERFRGYCAKRDPNNLVPSTVLGIVDSSCLVKS